jgi:hypothetical protein
LPRASTSVAALGLRIRHSGGNNTHVCLSRRHGDVEGLLVLVGFQLLAEFDPEGKYLTSFSIGRLP